jgi:hypothetical protein
MLARARITTNAITPKKRDGCASWKTYLYAIQPSSREIAAATAVTMDP